MFTHDSKIYHSATTSTKATQENFLQTSQWETHIGTMDFHKINYVWLIYPPSKHKKFQIASILLFHHSNTIGQFVKKNSWVALVGVVAL